MLSNVTTFETEEDEYEGSEQDYDDSQSLSSSIRISPNLPLSPKSANSPVPLRMASSAPADRNMASSSKRRSFLSSSQSSSTVDYSGEESVEAGVSEGMSEPQPISGTVPPSHRLSTTPLFPSPLAHALSAGQDDDNLDVMEMDADEFDGSGAIDSHSSPQRSLSEKKSSSSPPRNAPLNLWNMPTRTASPLRVETQPTSRELVNTSVVQKTET